MIFQVEGENGFKVRLETSGFKNSDMERLGQAAQLVADALGSKEFMDFCLEFSYEKTICSGWLWWKSCQKEIVEEFRWNNDLEREGIYDLLMAGEEALSEEGKDGEADIVLELDKRNKRGVLGYTYANTSKQWIYNWFFREGDIWDVAGNLAHEWTHKMGFGHEWRYNYYRQFTVPYAVGYFVRDYAKKKLTQQQ